MNGKTLLEWWQDAVRFGKGSDDAIDASRCWSSWRHRDGHASRVVEQAGIGSVDKSVRSIQQRDFPSCLF